MKEIKAAHAEKPIDLVIVPDAGSDNFAQHKELQDLGIQVLVLDHHPVAEESKYAIVVNNQLSPEYSNKQLSGAGVVFKFIEALDDEFGTFEANSYLDLLSLGNLADSISLASPESRYLIYKGFSSIKNDFLKEMIMKHIGDMKRVYPQTMSFGVIPKMNGIIRVGTLEEKIDMFRALAGVKENSVNSRTKKTETLAQKVTRLATNAYNRQKKLREKWVAVIEEQIAERRLNQNAFLLVELDSKFDRELGGVLAGKLAGEYRKPVLMLVYDEKKQIYSGSLRGFDGAMKNTKTFLNGLGLFSMLGGHENAAGFAISKANYAKLNDAINKALAGQELTGLQPIDVDFYLEDEDLTVDLVEKFAQIEGLFGKGVEKPLVATDITIDTSWIKKSNSSSMISFFYNNIKFVQFSGDKRLLDLLEDGHKVKLTLVGSLSMNHFAGSVTPQFLIEGVDIGEIVTEIEPIKEIKASSDALEDLFDW